MNDVEFSETMLIIGAGAHVPYGYPTAKQLTELFKALHRDNDKVVFMINGKKRGELYSDKVKICKYLSDFRLVEEPRILLESSNDYYKKLGDELEQFLIGFGESQVYSIDAYLANYLNRPEESINKLVPQLGKLLIAYFIYNYEKKIPIGFHESNWIQYIINEHLKDRKSLERFFESPPDIYTFNYDNHFEKSIFSHLKSYHGFSEDEALKKTKSLNIKHIYGHIDSLDTDLEESILRKSLENLFIIGEERSGDKMEKISQEMGRSMEKAKDVYFLGFGFDELNTKLIFRHRLEGRRKGFYPEFYSTNIGFSKLDQRRASEIIPDAMQFFQVMK